MDEETTWRCWVFFADTRKGRLFILPIIAVPRKSPKREKAKFHGQLKLEEKNKHVLTRSF